MPVWLVGIASQVTVVLLLFLVVVAALVAAVSIPTAAQPECKKPGSHDHDHQNLQQPLHMCTALLAQLPPVAASNPAAVSSGLILATSLS